jgi:hypothetical protein
MMERKVEVVCAWSGAAFCVVFGIGFALIAQFVPPPSPSLSAVEVAAMYDQRRASILAGSMLCFIGNGFYIPWTAVVSIVMWRSGFKLLSLVQLLGGGLGAMGPFIGTMFWIAAGFRSDQDPRVIQALNDVAWLFTIAYFVPVLFQFVAVGLAGLLATGEQRPWPRWMGYLSLWFATLALPAIFIPFFKTGPFAWDGVLAFWVPLVAFFGWFLAMIPLVLRSVRTVPAA